jgi:hypothetical protein
MAAGLPLRGAAAAPQPALRVDGRGIAGDRHRRQHNDLHRRQRAAVQDAGRRRRARPTGRHRSLAGRQRLRQRFLPELPRHPRAQYGVHRHLRLQAGRRAHEPRWRRRRRAHLRRHGVDQLLRHSRRASAGRPAVRGRGRKPAGRDAVRRTQSPVLEAPVQRRPGGRRPDAAGERQPVDRDRRRRRGLSRHHDVDDRHLGADHHGRRALAAPLGLDPDQPRRRLARHGRALEARRLDRAGAGAS